MVTTAAFNALLKTLEEPPEHVMFILATTELNKIPATVLSRCQRFDFRRITNDDIVGRLRVVAEGSGKSITDEALSLVAEMGNGSMRDSLSILDQCVGFSDETLTYDDILNIIGITDQNALFAMTEAIMNGNGGNALSVIDDVINNGKELDVFIDSLAKFLRDLLVAKVMDNPEKVLITSAENLEKMRLLADKCSQEKIINSLNLLNDSIIQAKNVTFKRTIYELAIVKMCDVRTSDSFDALLARISELEEKLQNGNFAVSSAPPKKEPSEKVQKAQNQPIINNTPQIKKADFAQASAGDNGILSKWEEIKTYIKSNNGQPLIPHLTSAKPMIIKNKLALVFSSSAMISKTVVSKQGYLDLIKTAVKAVTGAEMEVGCFSDKEVSTTPDAPKQQSESGFDKLEALAKKHDIIEIID